MSSVKIIGKPGNGAKVLALIGSIPPVSNAVVGE